MNPTTFERGAVRFGATAPVVEVTRNYQRFVVRHVVFDVAAQTPDLATPFDADETEVHAHEV